jgi:hypothetical protein
MLDRKIYAVVGVPSRRVTRWWLLHQQPELMTAQWPDVFIYLKNFVFLYDLHHASRVFCPWIRKINCRDCVVAKIITEYPHFFTATILDWKKLLKPDKYKNIIIDSMRFLVTNQQVVIYGFVIMINHIHFIWQMKAGIKTSYLQRIF